MLDPVSLGIGGALSLGGMVYSAIKGGQANKNNQSLLNQQQADNEEFRNNNRNYFDSVGGKSALEQVREAYEARTKTDRNTAVITGGTAEAEIAAKEAANKGYNAAINQLAGQGSEYSMRNEGMYRNTLAHIFQNRMNQNNQTAESASNVSGNMGNLLQAGATAGLFDKKV
jgi:hypothetical protein